VGRGAVSLALSWFAEEFASPTIETPFASQAWIRASITTVDSEHLIPVSTFLRIIRSGSSCKVKRKHEIEDPWGTSQSIGMD